MFSAKKRKGRKLYELARKGETVARKKNRVTIHSLALMSYHYPLLHFRVTCSTGTYVRALIHDFGTVLDTGAIMRELRRMHIGPYSVDDAASVSSLNQKNWRDRLMPVGSLQGRLQAYLFP